MARRGKSEARRAIEFAVVLAGMGVLLAVAALWRHHPARASVYAGAGFVVLGVALTARPFWLRIFRAWMRLAEGLGWVMTRLLLSIVYLVVVTPLGRVRRAMGRPTLDTVWRDGKTSYWIPKDAVEATIERYSKRY